MSVSGMNKEEIKTSNLSKVIVSKHVMLLMRSLLRMILSMSLILNMLTKKLVLIQLPVSLSAKELNVMLSSLGTYLKAIIEFSKLIMIIML